MMQLLSILLLLLLFAQLFTAVVDFQFQFRDVLFGFLDIILNLLDVSLNHHVELLLFQLALSPLEFSILIVHPIYRCLVVFPFVLQNFQSVIRCLLFFGFPCFHLKHVLAYQFVQLIVQFFNHHSHFLIGFCYFLSVFFIKINFLEVFIQHIDISIMNKKIGLFIHR